MGYRGDMWRLLTVLAAFTLVAGGAACGQKASAAEIVQASSAKTANAKTAKMAMTVQAAGKTVSADGVIDLVGKRALLSFDLATLGLPAQFGNGKLDATIIGSLVYMKLPAQLAAQVPGGKPFIKIDAAAVSQKQGIDLGALQQGGNPSDQLGYLRGASSGVTAVGSETLRGAKTTHYKATIDLDKAAAKMTAEQRKSIDAIKTQLGKSTFPMEVWIDSAGRARKMTYSIDASQAAAASGQAGAAAAQAGPTAITMELFDYGTTVNVNEPPADQVTDLTALASQAAGAAKTP
ncbi:MAG: hypothetical protein QOG64_1748 [Acidimicrobiaceae bacterium]|nr:hypothetical protein [Acidimicrobiaceae bacterium]